MTVQTLYCPDADVDRRGPGQQTAVTCAAGSLKPDATLILEYLLSKRADAKVKTKRHGNAINLAAKSGNKRAVGILLAAGVSAETRTPRDGTPLEIAANKGYTDIVRLLLKHLDAKDAEDYLREALSSAAVHGSFDTVRTLLAEHDNVQVKEKLLAKVVKSNWVTGGVIDLLRKHLPSKDIQSRLRILLKAAKNQRRPTFPIPLHPYSEDEARPSSIAACLLMHEDDQTLDIPEELAIALAEKSDEATISLLLKKSRNLEITAKLLAAAASNSFHGDAVLSVLLTRCPKLNIHQSTSILKAAVGNQELGVSMLETVLKCMSPDSPQIEDCIFVEAAGNPFHGKELIERLILLLPVDRKLIVTPEIVQTVAQNWYVP
jgi:Ankyrin repeats (3 copies)